MLQKIPKEGESIRVIRRMIVLNAAKNALILTILVKNIGNGKIAFGFRE